MSRYELSTEVTEMFDTFIVEWIQLHYNENEKERRFLFSMKLKDFVRYILSQNKITDSHIIPIIQYIIYYNKIARDVYYVDSIIDWERFDDPFYIIEHVLCIYIKFQRVKDLILQTFEDIEHGPTLK